jgi:hypothetical protein
MDPFTQLLIGLFLSFVGALFAPKPKPPKPGKLEDFAIPKATEGDVIGKVFGTVMIEDASVGWYGDLKTTAIKSKSGKK